MVKLMKKYMLGIFLICGLLFTMGVVSATEVTSADGQFNGFYRSYRPAEQVPVYAKFTIKTDDVRYTRNPATYVVAIKNLDTGDSEFLGFANTRYSRYGYRAFLNSGFYAEPGTHNMRAYFIEYTGPNYMANPNMYYETVDFTLKVNEFNYRGMYFYRTTGSFFETF